MIGIDLRRRFFAEEIQVVSNLRSARLVDALASVPREAFLPEGPWTIRSEIDMAGGPRQTADGDPRHLYHNVAVAIDASRMLFNGAPSLLAMAMDTLEPAPGHRVLHVGTGMGYYTAILAHCVGPSGRVLGIEIDPDLAECARVRLANMPWTEIRHGNAGAIAEKVDAILVNAGVTHPEPCWLDALSAGGRMILPITASAPGMGGIGKGLLLLVRATADPAYFTVRPVTFVAIFSAVGLRDDAINAQIGQALARQPFPRLTALRRDAHHPDAACWLHTPAFCWSLAPTRSDTGGSSS